MSTENIQVSFGQKKDINVDLNINVGGIATEVNFQTINVENIVEALVAKELDKFASKKELEDVKKLAYAGL